MTIASDGGTDRSGPFTWPIESDQSVSSDARRCSRCLQGEEVGDRFPSAELGRWAIRVLRLRLRLRAGRVDEIDEDRSNARQRRLLALRYGCSNSWSASATRGRSETLTTEHGSKATPGWP